MALLGVGAFLIVRRDAARPALEARIQTLERENRRLESRSAPQSPPVSSPRADLPPREPNEPRRATGTSAAAAEQEARIRQLQESLATASAQAAQSEEKAHHLEAQLGDLQVENKRLGGSEHELTEDLSRVNRLVNALQAELKSRNERLVQVEIANQKLKEQNGADAQRLNQLMQLTQELQDVHRRREVYLANVLRRYKEVTDQYRALSGVLDSRRDGGAPGLNSADLSRIQNAIAMAEEDLRQLNSLNAQALRLQKRLSGK
jgi:DNA repair exonuclease SbcCD ATPase subunit